MGLFKRVNDIITANLNEMVECFEDPQTMLKQAVREMEAAIGRAMEAAAKAIASERLLTGQLAADRDEADRWRRTAADAVARNDDDAARRALTRKAELQKLVAALSDQLATAQAESARLRREIDAMRVRSVEARRKLASLIARKRAADARKSLAATLGNAPLDGSAFQRFDRLCEQVELAEAEAQAFEELASSRWSDEPASRDLEIEAELEELKQRSRK